MPKSSDPQNTSLEALIECEDGLGAFSALRAAALDYGTVQVDQPQRFAFSTALGRIDLRQDAAGVSVGLCAEDAGSLQMMRDTVFHMSEQIEGLKTLNWSEAPAQRGLPANFRLVEVIGAWRIGRDFIRLRVSGENFDPFTRTGMHFRLAIPAPGRDPVWPHLTPEGRSRWPEGADALHTPAYTISEISPGEGWLEFDVYTHGRGPTCLWAEGLLAGTEARRQVGLSGPGGGWFPETDDLLIGGDETALPAILRILAQHWGRARVVIELADAGGIEAVPEDIRPLAEVLYRAEGGSAARWLEERVDRHGVPGFLWFAGETADAQHLRARQRSDWHLPRGRHYLSAYWTDRPD